MMKFKFLFLTYFIVNDKDHLAGNLVEDNILAFINKKCEADFTVPGKGCQSIVRYVDPQVSC